MYCVASREEGEELCMEVDAEISEDVFIRELRRHFLLHMFDYGDRDVVDCVSTAGTSRPAAAPTA